MYCTPDRGATTRASLGYLLQLCSPSWGPLSLKKCITIRGKETALYDSSWAPKEITYSGVLMNIVLQSVENMELKIISVILFDF